MALSVSTETEAAVKKFAEKKGVPVKEATEKLLEIALKRISTVAKYTKKKRAEQTASAEA